MKLIFERNLPHIAEPSARIWGRFHITHSITLFLSAFGFFPLPEFLSWCIWFLWKDRKIRLSSSSRFLSKLQTNLLAWWSFWIFWFTYLWKNKKILEWFLFVFSDLVCFFNCHTVSEKMHFWGDFFLLFLSSAWIFMFQITFTAILNIIRLFGFFHNISKPI